MELFDYRIQYDKARLTKADIDPDPIRQFESMFIFAKKKGEVEPNAMTLATYDEANGVRARVVLLKEVNADGFVFFTNYLSLKGKQLTAFPQAALVFWWQSIQAQIRITGDVQPIDPEESTAYFNSRPLESRVSAAISKQSEIIGTYAELISQYEDRLSQVVDDYVPRPEHWGGYLVKPREIEFWQGRPNRLHDRFRYSKHENSWHIDRLYP